MNFDLCRHMLLSYDNAENEPQAGSDAPAPLRREFQQALRHTLLSPMAGCSSKNERGGAGAGGVPPRVLSFTERPPPPQDRYTNVLKVRRAGNVEAEHGAAYVGYGAVLARRFAHIGYYGRRP